MRTILLTAASLALAGTTAFAEKLQSLGTYDSPPSEYLIDMDSIKTIAPGGKKFVQFIYWKKLPKVLEHRKEGRLVKYNKLKFGMNIDCDRKTASASGSDEAWLNDTKVAVINPPPRNPPSVKFPQPPHYTHALWQLVCSPR